MFKLAIKLISLKVEFLDMLANKIMPLLVMLTALISFLRQIFTSSSCVDYVAFKNAFTINQF